VGRQLEDCKRLAAQRGWVVGDEYVDDDVSAYSGKRRPEYARLLGDLRAASIDGVIVYHLDRLHRQPRELEEFFDVCKRAGVDHLATVTGRLDLANPDDRFQARILGAVATKASDDQSRRIVRKHEELALEGKPSGGGTRPFGYEDDKMTVRPVEAAVVQECAKRFLAGEPLASIVNDLNERHLTTSTGGRWSPQTLRRILGSGRISGQRERKGEIIGPAQWPALISPEDGAKIRAILANPERRTNKQARRYLLHGLLVCSHCGERLVARPRDDGSRRYACAKGAGFSGCGRTYVKAVDVEQFVAYAILRRLNSRELLKVMDDAQRSAPDAEQWWHEAEAAQTRLDELAAGHGNGEFSTREWYAARKPIEQRLTAARKQLAKVTRATVLDRYVGNADQLESDWDGLGLSQQHAIVAALVDHVVVGPGRRGYNRFDESRLTPAWRA
jgi:site-specific DNA recombinase